MRSHAWRRFRSLCTASVALIAGAQSASTQTATELGGRYRSGRVEAQFDSVGRYRFVIGDTEGARRRLHDPRGHDHAGG